MAFLSIRVRLNWNIEDNRNQYRMLNSKMGPYHVVLAFLKTSPENGTLTAVEMQQSSDVSKTHFKPKTDSL